MLISIRNGIKNSLTLVDELLYPQFCELCNNPLIKAETLFCFDCRGEFEQCRFQNGKPELTSADSLDHTLSIYRFDENLQKCIHELKYNGFTKLIEFLIEPHKNHLRKMIDDLNINVIIPIPLHSVKLRERGFNQALMIADVIANLSGIPMNDCLNRTKWTESQTKLNIHERKKNTENAFLLKDNIVADRVLLIDDVLTTGATANACARTLKSSNISWTGLFTLGSA